MSLDSGIYCHAADICRRSFSILRSPYSTVLCISDRSDAWHCSLTFSTCSYYHTVLRVVRTYSSGSRKGQVDDSYSWKNCKACIIMNILLFTYSKPTTPQAHPDDRYYALHVSLPQLILPQKRWKIENLNARVIKHRNQHRKQESASCCVPEGYQPSLTAFLQNAGPQ